MAPPDLVELLIRLARALEKAEIEYVVGGALALGMWAETRGTRDIDVTVYLPIERIETVFSLLEELGGTVHRDVCRWQLATAGYFAADFDLFRIDVFLPGDSSTRPSTPAIESTAPATPVAGEVSLLAHPPLLRLPKGRPGLRVSRSRA